jgi:hypothetical protein
MLLENVDNKIYKMLLEFDINGMGNNKLLSKPICAFRFLCDSVFLASIHFENCRPNNILDSIL